MPPVPESPVPEPPLRVARAAAGVAGAAVLLLTACLGQSTQAPEQTAVIEDMGVDVSSRRARLAANEIAQAYMGTVELTADSIRSVTDDPDVALRALSWKANAVPVIQRAMHHTDPLVSFLDGWVFVKQMHDFYDSGRGTDDFGAHQVVAVNALDSLELRTDSLIHLELDSVGYATISTFAENWSVAHPLTNDLFVRQSVASAASAELAEQQMGGLSALGSLQELAMDAQQMAQSYLAYTPKVVLWQAELMVESMMDTTRLSPLLSRLDRLAVMEAATTFLDEFPDLVAAERRATLAGVSALADTSIVSVLRVASVERQIVLAELARLVREERAALLGDMDATVALAMERGREEAVAVIDHTLWRIAQGLVVLGGLLLLGLWLVLRRYLPRRGAAGGG